MDSGCATCLVGWASKSSSCCCEQCFGPPGKGVDRFDARSSTWLSFHPDESLRLGRGIPVAQVKRLVRVEGGFK